MGELTVPWESEPAWAHERNLAGYTELDIKVSEQDEVVELCQSKWVGEALWQDPLSVFFEGWSLGLRRSTER